jgi:hypothetical protein
MTLDAVAELQAARATVPEIASHLQTVFGQKLTALTVGVGDAKAIGRIARGEDQPHLRIVFQIVKLLEQVDSPATVSAWFVGMNPYLDDIAPARMIRMDADRVLQAARRFLADG